MSMLEEFRREKDRFFEEHPQSPLTAEKKKGFRGLSYYPENPALDLEVTVTPFEESPEVEMLTNTGDVRRFRKHGRFTFGVEGQTAELTLFEDEHGGFFLPFADATSGNETYGAGRYLEPEPLGGTRIRVDFNLAYNPYCAYNPRWSCPLTPPENRLKVPIRAGEKAYYPESPEGH